MADPDTTAKTRARNALTQTLIDATLGVPGVLYLEPGLITTLRTLDARIRRSQRAVTHFGLTLDDTAVTARVTVEVGVTSARPVRDIAADIQAAIETLVRDAGYFHVEVLVRAQSVHS